MHKISKIYYLIILLVFGLLSSRQGIAQLKDKAISPIINSDRTVTFRLNAPEADSVGIWVEFLKDPQLMKKDDKGVWSITLGPAEPGIYHYSFLIDGVRIIDPGNPYIKSSLTPNMSLLNYPGSEPMFYDELPVPHGVLHYHRYRSKSLNANRGFYVYTPPDYNKDNGRRFPVLYLLHGYTDDESGWTAVGRANFILDNLISQKKAEPMLIVMPFGYVPPLPGDDEGEWENWFKNVTPRVDQYIVNEIVHQVEKQYNVSSESKYRAIAGLSMGGGSLCTLV